MRAASLSNAKVQEAVAASFVPVRVVIPPKSESFPLSWPALAGWRCSYDAIKGEGFTGCTVVSPDLEAEYGSTGSSFVWEMFDSPAYDADKFVAMLQRARQRWDEEQKIRSTADETVRAEKVAAHRAEVRKAVGKEGAFRLPPKGFTLPKAVELFQLSGDLPK